MLTPNRVSPVNAGARRNRSRRDRVQPAAEAVLLVQELGQPAGGVVEGRRPEQRVERADLDADAAVHAQRRSRSRSGRARARCRGRPPPRRPARSLVATRCRCTSPGTPARTACRPCSSPPRAMTPRLPAGHVRSCGVPRCRRSRRPQPAAPRRERRPAAGSARGVRRVLRARPGLATRAASTKSLRSGCPRTRREQQRVEAGVALEVDAEHLMVSRSCQAAPGHTPVAVARRGAVAGEPRAHAGRGREARGHEVRHDREAVAGAVVVGRRPVERTTARAVAGRRERVAPSGSAARRRARPERLVRPSRTPSAATSRPPEASRGACEQDARSPSSSASGRGGQPGT